MLNQQIVNFLFSILLIFQSSLSFARWFQLTRIHTVADITAMSNIILPARGNLIYVSPKNKSIITTVVRGNPFQVTSSGGNGGN